MAPRALARLLLLLPLVMLSKAPATGAPPTELRVVSYPPATFDPAFDEGGTGFSITNQLSSGLTRYDPWTGELALELAASVSHSTDLRVWTFTLRSGLRYSDGQPILAGHFEHAMKRVLDPRTGSFLSYQLYDIAGAVAFNQQPFDPATPDDLGISPDTVGVRALDALRLEVTLEQPAAYAPALMSNAVARPLVPGSNPDDGPTSGPYRVSSHGPTTLTLEKNPYWYDAATVAIDRIAYTSPDGLEPGALRSLYLAGAVDVVAALDVLGGTDGVRGDPALAPDLRIEHANATYYYSFDNTQGITSDRNVRLALSWAIDRGRVAQALSGFPARSFTPVLTPPFAADHSLAIGPTLDEATARHYKALAGNGFPRAIKIVFNDNVIHGQIAKLIKEDWERVLGPDFHVSFQESTFDLYLRMLFGHRPPLPPVIRLGWGADYPDADNFLRVVHESHGENHSGWSNAAFDALVAAARIESDAATRRAQYAEAERLLLTEEGAIAALSHAGEPLLARPYLTRQGVRVASWSLGTP